MKFGKITIIGSGRVGTSAAFALICQNIAKEITLLDTREDVLDAESIDLRDAKYFSYTGHVHKGTWEDAKESQIIVICAGEVLRPESSLHQVVSANKKCFDDIFGKLGTLNSQCIVVVATSPVDALTQYAQKLCGLPKNQVIGTGTLLDTERLRVKLGKKFKINEKSVHAYVMGEKGDTAFVPWSHATVAGRKLSEFFAEDSETQSQLLDTFVTKIKTKTDKMLLSKHGTNFGIAACIAAVCKDIIYDTNMVLPLSCWVEDFGCYMSVLCTLGERGITKCLPLDLTDKEKQCFSKCSDSIWSCLKLLGFNKEGYGAVGEKKPEIEVSAPGGGLDWRTGSDVDIGKGPELGGGRGTDVGGLEKTGWEPLKESEIGAHPVDYSSKLATTDIRGIDLGGKRDLGTDLSTTSGVEGGVTTDLAYKGDLGTTETTGLGRDLSKSTDFGTTGTTDWGGLGKDTPTDIGGGLATTDKGDTGLGTDFGKSDIGGMDVSKKMSDLGTDLGGKKTDTDVGLGKGITETSFGGGPGVGTTSDIGKTDIGGTDVGQKSDLSDLGVGHTDIGEGLKKDLGEDKFGSEKKLPATEEGRGIESVGRPIRQ